MYRKLIIFLIKFLIMISVFKPIKWHPLFVYHLELEDDCHYVESTYNLNQRYAQHLDKDGAKWTKIHKPTRIVQVWTDGTLELENKITLELIDRYGKDKVRGGKWTKVLIDEHSLTIKEEQKEQIEHKDPEQIEELEHKDPEQIEQKEQKELEQEQKELEQEQIEIEQEQIEIEQEQDPEQIEIEKRINFILDENK